VSPDPRDVAPVRNGSVSNPGGGSFGERLHPLRYRALISSVGGLPMKLHVSVRLSMSGKKRGRLTEKMGRSVQPRETRCNFPAPKKLVKTNVFFVGGSSRISPSHGQGGEEGIRGHGVSAKCETNLSGKLPAMRNRES